MSFPSRRYFFLGLLAASAGNRLSAARAQRKVLICLMDGFGLDYVAKSDMPGLKKLMSSGTFVAGKDMMPSLTNVNNSSLATGSYPERHGITANTFYDPKLKHIAEMCESHYLLAPTLFESARRKGWKTKLIAAKEKVRTLIGPQADSSMSAEKQGVPMYEAATNYWTFEQGRAALKSPEVDLLYLTTTDYMMHTYAPEQAESLEHLHRVDRILSGIVDDHPNLELYLCADHGMNAKTTGIDVVRVLAAKGVAARAVAAIADKHKVHHKDLGGSIYVDLERPDQVSRARDVLTAQPGIEEVISRVEASRRFHLLAERTGDLFVLADKTTALGDLDSERADIRVRTHGSLHESNIPLLVYGRKPGRLQNIVDLTAARAWEERT